MTVKIERQLSFTIATTTTSKSLTMPILLARRAPTADRALPDAVTICNPLDLPYRIQNLSIGFRRP